VRIVVEPGACCGHEACVEICPEVFALDASTGLVELVSAAPAAALRVRVEAAIEECPTDAISLANGSGGES
jgi:ferredoxin